jgi:hypothetical protein
MRTALVLKQKEQEGVDVHVSQVIVFDVEDGRVTGVENATVRAGDFDSFLLWAIAWKVKEIYIPEASEWLKMLFGLCGVMLKAYPELEEDKLFRTFIL